MRKNSNPQSPARFVFPISLLLRQGSTHILFIHGYCLGARSSVARVRPRTSKGITDLLLPPSTLGSPPSVGMERYRHIQSICISNHLQEVSFVNGINQTNHSTN